MNLVKFCNYIKKTVLLLVLLFLYSCSKDKFDELYIQFNAVRNVGIITNIYPAENSIFPPEIAPPTITWVDSLKMCDTWYVGVEFNGIINFKSPELREPLWKPNIDDWEKIKSLSKESSAKLYIFGTNSRNSTRLVAGTTITFTTSKDEVGASIFFRTVPLPFKYAVENLDKISWRLGDISSDKPASIVMEKLQVCANCHSFSNDGKTMGMDVDYANDKGSYAILNVGSEMSISIENIISWSNFKREDGKKTYGLLSAISPDGRYAISTVKDRSIFVSINDLNYSQLFFPIKGILAVYDNKEKKFFSLPGADDPEFVQSNPIWSPDGKYILFTRTKAYTIAEAEKSNKAILPVSVAKEFMDGSKRFYYDIYRIPFNDGKGGKAELLKGASQNDMSNFFPKFSPDGKWIVFTQAKNFMLLQKDSKMYIMPAEGGTPRLMNCNTSEMNSWHSFSPNGKWMVFASKIRGPYTKLYLTHIDEKGNDSPPICLEYMNENDLAANIPEFVNASLKTMKIKENFMKSDFYSEARISEKAKSGDLKGAIADLSDMINKNPNDFQLYFNRGLLEKKTNNAKAALADFSKAIDLNKSNAEAYYQRAYIKIESEDYKGAIEDLNISIKLDPKNIMAIYELALAKYSLNDFNGSIEICNRILNVKNDFGLAYFQRALCNLQLNKTNIICDDLLKAKQLGVNEAVQVYNDYCGK